jgi:hypothetical protein
MQSYADYFLARCREATDRELSAMLAHVRRDGRKEYVAIAQTEIDGRIYRQEWSIPYCPAGE